MFMTTKKTPPKSKPPAKKDSLQDENEQLSRQVGELTYLVKKLRDQVEVLVRKSRTAQETIDDVWGKNAALQYQVDLLVERIEEIEPSTVDALVEPAEEDNVS